MSEDVWSARDTTPSAIEAALRDLLGRALPGGPHVRARAGDEPRRDRRPRLPRRGREPAGARRPLPPVAAGHRRGRAGAHHARRLGDASRPRTRCTSPATSRSGASASRSRSARSTSRASTRSSTRCWCPTSRRWCGRRTATSGRSTRCGGWQHRARRHAGRPEVAAAFERAADLTRSAYVVDLAWLRSTPWRERDRGVVRPAGDARARWRDRQGRGPPPAGLDRRRRAVLRLARVAPAVAPEALARARRRLDGTLPRAPRRGHARAGAEDMGAPGLGGVTIEMASGESVALDRGPGGLHAVRRDARRRASRTGP